MLEGSEPVTDCDQLFFFLLCKAKSEVAREPFRVASDRLVESFCRDFVAFRQIAIQKYPVTTHHQNPVDHCFSI